MNLLQSITKCKLFSESLAEDVARSELDSGIEAAEAGQQLEPWMEAGFQDSQVVADDIELASQASYRPLTRSERCRVRNTLYLALTLDQIRRAGDVKCIRLNQARGVRQLAPGRLPREQDLPDFGGRGQKLAFW